MTGAIHRGLDGWNHDSRLCCERRRRRDWDGSAEFKNAGGTPALPGPAPGFA